MMDPTSGRSNGPGEAGCLSEVAAVAGGLAAAVFPDAGGVPLSDAPPGGFAPVGAPLAGAPPGGGNAGTAPGGILLVVELGKDPLGSVVPAGPGLCAGAGV